VATHKFSGVLHAPVAGPPF